MWWVMLAHRSAFSLVEVLTALALLGVAAAGLAAAAMADRRLRTLAAQRTSAASAIRDRLEALAARPCARGDTAGVRALASGTERWRALALPGAWRVVDSVSPSGSGPVISVEARVACPD
jgi:prepilin-type N-terminal cleavage/methylation domain-containing protein